jgi:hypothetical protein
LSRAAARLDSYVSEFWSEQKNYNVMKKLILIITAAAGLVLAGCNRGGTSDQYGTSSGNANGSSNSAAGSSTITNSNSNP